MGKVKKGKRGEEKGKSAGKVGIGCWMTGWPDWLRNERRSALGE